MSTIIHASTGGRTFLPGHSSKDCVPGTLRHLGFYGGRSTTPMEYEASAARGQMGAAFTPESQAIAFAEAFRAAAVRMRLAHPLLQPPPLREALESMTTYCDSTVSVTIHVWEYEPLDRLSALFNETLEPESNCGAGASDQ